MVPRARLLHLTRRFLGSLWPGGPPAGDDAWARSLLLPGEVALWRRLSGPDRRHAVAVARRVEVALGPSPARPVLAAALLHDVGKVEARLGTAGRVVATLVAAASGRRGRGSGRIATYLRHPELGAELLRRAGADPVTVAWAAEHHLPPVRWSVEPATALALKAADDD